MDAGTALGIGVGAATTLGGAVLGWYLNERSAQAARAEERAHQERLTLLDRQEAAAASLQRELTDALSALPIVAARAEVIAKQAEEAYRALRSAGSRAAVLADEEAIRRFRSLDMAL
jgi:transcription initiation factor TFIIIB Brf1 subunit/transcription initiation factor TFIIB